MLVNSLNSTEEQLALPPARFSPLVCGERRSWFCSPGRWLGLWIFVFATTGGCGVGQFALLAQPLAQPSANAAIANSPSLDKLFTEWVLEAIPHEFQDNKRWGRQSEFPVRLRWRRDPDGRWETYREKELKNHGEWSKFSASLLNPAERFQIQLTNIHTTDSGDLTFDCSIQAALAIAGRQAQWNRGVQLYSVGFEGTAAVRLRLSCWVRTEFKWQDFPPEILISPKITAADLELQEFRLDHVGKFGGEVAQQITRLARQILEEKIAEKEQELPAKLNAQIDKHRDRLRLKPGEGKTWEWTQPLQPFLPLPVKEKW